MARHRNLVIGCDGTWNDTGDPAVTNVVKLLNGLLKRNQVQHYEEGVGTAHWEALPGGIYGKGLDRQILGGYRFLRRRFSDKNWEKQDNKVFIFGFSRGSYAARRLAGLIEHSGIPKYAKDIDLAWNLYLQRDHASVTALKAEGRLFDIPIEVVGVWDTVKATNDPDFHDKILSPCVVAGYHAMAIDEKRKFFPVLKWSRDARARQIWFSGVHSDAGGGYAQTGLSDIALHWMINSTYTHGLRFKVSAIKKLKMNPGGELHDSFEGIWKALGASKRKISGSALVHDSVRERLLGDNEYAPHNLPAEPNYVSS